MGSIREDYGAVRKPGDAIDAYFVGGLGMSQMGAVSVVFPIVQIIIGLGMMFGAGASSYISRLLGKGDNEQADKTASTSLFSGLLVGAIIIIGIMVFLDPVLTALGSTETILPYARAYAKIYVTGSIINVFTVMMNNLLTAQGATKFTMIAMLTGSITNVILDPIMIYGIPVVRLIFIMHWKQRDSKSRKKGMVYISLG